MAETGTSLRLHGLGGSPAKAAVHRAVKPKNAATCLTAAVSLMCKMLRDVLTAALRGEFSKITRTAHARISPGDLILSCSFRIAVN